MVSSSREESVGCNHRDPSPPLPTPQSPLRRSIPPHPLVRHFVFGRRNDTDILTNTTWQKKRNMAVPNQVEKHCLEAPLLDLFWRLRPRADLIHRPPPHRRHNLALHTLDLILEVNVFFGILSLTRSVPEPPARDNNDCNGNSDDEVDPHCWCDCKTPCSKKGRRH